MKLHLYFIRKFLWLFFGISAVFLGIVLMIDMVDQIRRLGGTGHGPGVAFDLALLNAPESIYRMLPLLVMLATIALFLSLARSNELVVSRASGRSALVSLAAPTITAFLLGIVAVAALNPIVAATKKAYKSRLAQYTHGEQSTLSVSSGGFWLRQSTGKGQLVIRAAHASPDGTRLRGVTVFGFNAASTPTYRIEAASARLRTGEWLLKETKRWQFKPGANPERGAIRAARLSIASDLTRARIRDSFGRPATISIWKLPGFIARLTKAGFSALPHRVWFQMELASPLLLAAMVLIGASFTMRHNRQGRTGLMVLIALIFGFAIYFLRNFSQVMGDNGQIPVIIAAWTPPMAAISLSLGLLFHMEDG